MTDDQGTRTGLRCPECRRGFLYEWRGLVWCSSVGLYGEGVPCGYGVTSDVTRAEAEREQAWDKRKGG